MILIFARHGQTENGAENRYEGATDSPLTSLGQKQAEKLAKLCQEKKIKKIYSSPIGRALATANVVAKTCRLKTNIVDELKEVCFGEWEERSVHELANLEVWEKRNKNFFQFIPPGDYKGKRAESYEMLFKRLEHFFYKLAKEKESPILIVAHVGVARCAKRYFEKISEAEFRDFRLPNSALYIVAKEDHKIKTRMISLD